MAVATSEGHCLCGDVRYQAIGEPLWVAHCHCQSCRRNTGSVLATFVGYSADQITFNGTERGIFNSSPDVRRGFCKRCGTPLSYESERHPGEVHVYLSTLTEPDQFPARLHVFHVDRVPWFESHDDLPRYALTSRDNDAASYGPKFDN